MMREIAPTKEFEAMMRSLPAPRLMLGLSIFLTGLTLLTVETVNCLFQ
jgi:hypothetical protein